MTRRSNIHWLRLNVLIVAACCIAGPACRSHAQNAAVAEPADREYAAATGMLNRGLNEMAVQEYRRFLQAHGDHASAPSARYGLGVALFRLRKYEEAERELKTLDAAAPFEFAAESLLIRGQCLLATQKPAEAATLLSQLVERHADHATAPDAVALLVESLYRAGDIRAVREPCEFLASHWPEHPLRERAEYFNALAAMTLEENQYAAQAFDQLQKRFPNGQFADQIALLLAQCWHKAGDVDRAGRQYELTIKRNNPETLSEALYGQATLLLAGGKAEQAGRSLDRFLEQFPHHRLAAPAHQLRGRIHFDQKQYDPAVTQFQQSAAAGGPGDAAAFWIAKCHLRKNDFAGAASLLNEAINTYPDSSMLPEMTYDRAVSLTRIGDYDAAAKSLETFRRLFPKHALLPDVVYLQASVEHARHDYAKSRAFCSEFEESQAGHALLPSVRFLAAEDALMAGDLPAATAEYRQFLSAHPADANAATAKFRLGSALYRLNQLDESRQILTQVVDGKKTAEPFREALWMLGDASFQQQQQWSDAIAFMTDFLSFGANQPSADDAIMKTGLAHLRLDRADEAIRSFERLVSVFPQSAHRTQAQFEKGQILLARKDFDAAAELFQGVLDTGADSRFAPFALDHLASIAMLRKQYEQAAKLYEQAARSLPTVERAADAMFQRGAALMLAKQYPAASSAFAEFVKTHPTDVRIATASAQRAIALSRIADHAEALKVIAEIENNHDESLDAPTQASLSYEKAWCLRETNKVEMAADAYRALLAAFPEQPVAVNAAIELAELEMTARRFQQAVDVLTPLNEQSSSASHMVSDDVREQALYRLAACHYELGHYAESAELFDRFITANSQSALTPTALALGGESHYKAGEMAKAVTRFSRLIEDFPADPAVASSLLRLGECRAAAQQWPQSEASFTAFLAKFPDHELWFQAQFGKGWAAENQARHDEAIAAYKAVTDRHKGPTAARAQFQIGECLFAKKQYDEAVRELLKVDILYAYPEWSAAALYEAGRCFEELRQPAEAKIQFQLVQQKFPESRWTAMAAQRLTALAGGNRTE